MVLTDHTDMMGIASDIQRGTPNILAVPEGKRWHEAFQKGGQELQINVVDSATLRAAQKNPEQYRDLVVRIAGFSEFFVRQIFP